MAKRTKKVEVEAPKAAVEAQTVVTETPEVQPEVKAKRSMAKTLAKYRAGYEGGRTCGDDLAHRLDTMSLEAIYAEAERVCGLEPGTLEARYAGLNPGQKRMNAGNRIRAALKRKAKAEAETQQAA